MSKSKLILQKCKCKLKNWIEKSLYRHYKQMLKKYQRQLQLISPAFFLADNKL